MATSAKAEDEAVTNFRTYLRIPSVQPNINYDECVNFLKQQAESIGLDFKVYSVTAGKPIVVLTWEGKKPSASSILLNSHMDVVPVFPDKWKHDPFGAEKDKDGNIYARGSQDMKCVGIQYLEAIRRLKKKNVRLLRTIHVSFVPDEEIGGIEGMKKFVTTLDFLSLNVGFAMDEGMASPNEEYVLFYGERSIWHLHIHCPGSPGHGSLILPDTAGEKVRYIIDKFMDLRQKEKEKLQKNPQLKLGDVTTINLTQLQGGVQSNVVPPELTVVFDVRLALDVAHTEFEEMVNKWCREAGEGIYVEYEQKCPLVDATKLDNTNPWWLAFKAECDKMNLKLVPQIFPAATDSRYIRGIGLPALGFSPMNHTPVLLHDHDEYLNESIFLKGIEIYENIIPALANLSDPQ
ncbi:aminoacylase-1A-like [Schistocerca americana]|uniref:aminoacylase-1A-like n=1 Tax=Schistocerca americana TaxID=7009 RepID=UPI001F4F160D|nr:aminoacylase-1A-like [Schistocerca americana]XP_049782175.1 aminoacylase-1A [Schistocerca cancellata]XP_049953675.1 aminoacylase-1A [Schistocerca serialis cubense]